VSRAFCSTGRLVHGDLVHSTNELLKMLHRYFRRHVRRHGQLFSEITLCFRKTNTSDSSQARVHEIHPLTDPDDAPINAFAFLDRWLALKEQRMGYQPAQEHFLFCCISTDGTLRVRLL
jgi:hypothetical protein